MGSIIRSALPDVGLGLLISAALLILWGASFLVQPVSVLLP